MNAKKTALRTFGNLILTASVATRLLLRRKYDVVLTTTAPPFLPGAAEVNRFIKRTPFVYMVYDLEPNRTAGLGVISQTSPIVKGMRVFQRRVLSRATKVVAIGRCMADLLQKDYSVKDSSLSVVPIGSHDMPFQSNTNTEFRARHGLEGFVLMYAGNFGRYHDFDTILDAAKELRQRAPDVNLVLVGRGAQKKHVQHRVEAEGLTNVRLMDFVDESQYPDMLASADACLVTMEAGLEGTCVPSKFYSILSAARPTVALVASDCEVARCIEEYDCGRVVKQRNAEDLVEAVVCLRENPSLLAEMGQKAREAYEANYNSSDSANEIFQLLVAASRNTELSGEQESFVLR
jgi:glycosyltransferase involved in cell wall biosynthesis